MASIFDRLKRLSEFLDDKDPVPNKFTVGLGKLVRQAREEAGLSQSELASLVYRSRATISNIETGKSELTVSTLALVSTALEKPITYFLPWFIYDNLEPERLSPLEQEMLIQFKNIYSEDLQLLAIRQTKEIAEMSLKKLREDKLDIARLLADEDQEDD